MAKQFRTCSVDGCNRPIHGYGWCDSHYHRWLAHGDPLAGRIPKGAASKFFADVVLKYEGDECLIWPFYKSPTTGYPKIGSKFAHRKVCEEINGPPPSPQHQAAHSCGKGHLGCVTKKHLSWKTPKENMADTVAHGTKACGTKHGSAKLTDAKVLEIRAIGRTMSTRCIADRFGVDVSTINSVLARTSWAWLN